MMKHFCISYIHAHNNLIIADQALHNKSFSILHSAIIFVFVLTSCVCEVAPPEAVLPVPSERQLAWHELEQYAFIHFTTNTFTGKEWGYGDEQPAIFDPSIFDAEQWAKAIRDAGLNALILTCKHHDGFCLWPSQYTEHSVKNSPFQNGKGDVVKAVSDACRKYGLKFGVYLSPWDRNRFDYATPEYITYYRNQLRELLTHYGDLFEIWFDGANGGDGYYGGAREKRKIENSVYYDWANTHSIIRELAPGAVIFSDAGPDVRWCGNEYGFAGETNWCTIQTDTLYPGKYGINDLLNQGDEQGSSWTPAEVDVSIRPGWFYHESEDSLVRSPENLFKIYLQSVGRGAGLLLNIPPDKRGLLHENDIQSLQGWKLLRDRAFAVNLAANAAVNTDTYRGKSKKYAGANVTDGNKDTYWATDDGITSAYLEIDLGKPRKISYILMQEYIRLGQRVKHFTVEVRKDNAWLQVAEGATIGYKRILAIEPVNTQKVRINITDSKICPLIADIKIY
ncbi:MAG: alpha-L-fucosidase [Dysgonamonadaceae bacterium]|nr:alpha-L-fucosidase [Dysgonamonadaceae bacterium]